MQVKRTLATAVPGGGLRVPPAHRPELRLLGGFDLQVAGRSTPVPPASQRVLALLAVHDRPLMRPYAAGVLWPSATRERSMACLRSAVRTCPPALLRRSHTQLGLADHVVIDYRCSLDAAKRVLSGPAVNGSADSVLDLLSGELLPDFADAWIAPFRAALHQIRLSALEVLADELLRAGQPALAARAAATAVEAEPFRESAHLRLMRALLAEGNRVQAILHYEQLCRLLLAELGVPPSFQLADVVGVTPDCAG